MDGFTSQEEEFFNDYNGLSFNNLLFNYHEIQYNIAVCHILQKNYTKAHKSLLKVVDSLPQGEVKDEYQKLLGLLNIQIQKG